MKKLNLFLIILSGDRTVVGSDTVVVKDGEVYGKPKNREEAIKMLKNLQGGAHTVFTSLSVLIEDRGEYKEYKEGYEALVYIKAMIQLFLQKHIP